MAALMFIFALSVMLSLLSVQGVVMNPTCNPVGTKSITISWRFSPTQARKSPHIFIVYFCKKMCHNTSTNYHFGCAVNVTKGKPIYSCDIGKPLNLQFPQESTFSYYVKEDNGQLPLSFVRCPVNMLIQCSKPTGLKLKPVGKGKLKLNWSKPTDMGRYSDHLCYFIRYFREDRPEDKVDLSFDHLNYEYELKSLKPFWTYHVYLWCALTCAQRKSLPAGPAIATTIEEEPQDQVIFQDWFQTTVDHESRNVTLFLEIPDKEKWNGRVRQIRVFCYRDEHLCTNITLDELIVSDDSRHQLQYNVTFPFLRREMTYYVKADYCNSVGCSPTSRNQTIIPAPPDVAKFKNPKPQKSLSTGQRVGIGVSSAFAVLVIVITMVYFIKKYFCNCTEPHANLNDAIGPLDHGAPRDEEVAEEQPEVDSVYSRADAHVPRVSRSTLNPETTDFQSASVRSINSFNSIGGLTDQSTIRDDNSASIPNNEGSSQENVRLLRRADFPSVQHRPSHEDNSLLPTSV